MMWKIYTLTLSQFILKYLIYWANPLTNKTEQINKITMINGKPHIKDPLTGKFEDAEKYKVAVDHILPKSYFTIAQYIAISLVLTKLKLLSKFHNQNAQNTPKYYYFVSLKIILC